MDQDVMHVVLHLDLWRKVPFSLYLFRRTGAHKDIFLHAFHLVSLNKLAWPGVSKLFLEWPMSFRLGIWILSA